MLQGWGPSVELHTLHGVNSSLSSLISYASPVLAYLYDRYAAKALVSNNIDGKNLIVGCGKKKCHKQHLHPQHEFISIDVEPTVEPDITASIEDEIHENIIPNKSFPFIYYEGVPSTIFYHSINYAFKNASSKLKDQGVAYIRTGYGCLIINQGALDTFKENLTHSGFKYAIDVVELLLPNTPVEQRMDHGMIFLLSNDVDTVDINALPKVLFQTLKMMSPSVSADQKIKLEPFGSFARKLLAKIEHFKQTGLQAWSDRHLYRANK